MQMNETYKLKNKKESIKLKKWAPNQTARQPWAINFEKQTHHSLNTSGNKMSTINHI